MILKSSKGIRMNADMKIMIRMVILIMMAIIKIRIAKKDRKKLK